MNYWLEGEPSPAIISIIITPNRNFSKGPFSSGLVSLPCRGVAYSRPAYKSDVCDRLFTAEPIFHCKNWIGLPRYFFHRGKVITLESSRRLLCSPCIYSSQALKPPTKKRSNKNNENKKSMFFDAQSAGPVQNMILLWMKRSALSQVLRIGSWKKNISYVIPA